MVPFTTRSPDRFLVDPERFEADLERIAALTVSRAPWLDFEAASVAPEALAAVPRGPTLLLGMGGSALGARCALEFAKGCGQAPDPVVVLDTVDEHVAGAAFGWAKEHNAHLMVISKSGTTVEVHGLLDAALAELAVDRVVLIGDPGANALDAKLDDAGVDVHRLTMPREVGGRYSVFTAVGQAPLAAAGLDPQALIRGARAAASGFAAGAASARQLATALAFRRQHPAASSVWMAYSQALEPFVDWVQQLECESLGRTRQDGSRVGELVVALRGPADQHSVAQLLLDGPVDKRITLLDFEQPVGSTPQLMQLGRLREIERDATFDALELPKRTMVVEVRRLDTLGAMMLASMAEVVLAAEELGIDPYGQPAVERIKIGIRRRLSPADQA